MARDPDYFRRDSDNENKDEDEDEDALKGEEAFKKTKVLPWTKQITIRSVVVSFVLSLLFNFIVCKLNLTTGVIPSLNVAAGLLGFRSWKLVRLTRLHS